MKRQVLILFGLIAFIAQFGLAQEVAFEKEVRQISARFDSLGWERGGTVFTGSSTIRMWKTLQADLGEGNLINTGFGGSKASDLETHLYPLVIKFEPKQVFIYEGDNDIWAGVGVVEILTSLDNIVNRLQLIDPNTTIYLIGAKPSPSRWEKKSSYEIFNQLLKEYGLAKEGVEFVDTWKALTDPAGNPRPELYIQDQLHLNDEGYKIWASIFRDFFKN
jgi:lysophospholipase L1-like esterase